MRVLNTRPESEAAALDQRLMERGHESVPCSLLTIRPRVDATVDLIGAQAVAATSGAAIRALAQLDSNRTLPIYAVGQATAAVARDVGFGEVKAGAGDVTALAEQIIKSLDPTAGAVVHPRGAVVAGDLAGDLTAAGFTVRSPILYDAEPARELPSAGRAALESGNLGAVLFFSPRTAATFVSLVTNAELTERCQTLDAYCLSPAVANAARANAAGVVPWRNIRCAVEPDQDSLLNLLADS